MYSAKVQNSLLAVALGLLVWVPGFAASAVVGSVAGSTNALIGNQPLMPHATLFSGDTLKVGDGAAVVAIGSANRMILGRETVASFLRESDEVTVLLGQGNVSMYHVDGNVGLRVKVGDLTVVPAAGFKTLGEVAMVNGTVVVTTKEGSLLVERNGSAVEVPKGKIFTIPAKPARAGAGGAAGAAPGGGWSAATWFQFGGLVGSALSTIMSAVALDRAGSARDAAATAQATAADAEAAASAASTAATSALNASISAGCALNTLAFKLGITPSPFTPPTATPGC